MMKAYPAYKESGIAWLGEIPKHWGLKRMKTAVTSSVNGVWGNEEQGDKDDVICIRVADFDMATLGVSTQNLTVRNISKSQQNGRIFHFGDLLIEKSGGGDNQPAGRMIRFDLQSTRPAVCSNFVGKLSIRDSFASNYFLYYAYNLYSKNVNTRSIKQTTGIQNLDLDSYLNELMPVPTLVEQQAIADYLDRKTAVIDSLIAKKERQIELLQEQRTGVINHAVTKGLNPQAPLKDSGIPWLGRIPSPWREERLKFITNFVTSGSRGWAQYYSDKGAMFIRVGNLSAQNSIQIDLSDCQHVSPPKGSEGQRTQIMQNDVLIAITGATIGSVGIVHDDLGEAYVNQHVALTRPILSQVDPRWLAYCIFSEIGQIQIEQLTTGGTKEGLGLDDIRNFIIPLPDLDEQRKNIAWLENKISKITNATKSTQREIELLREYRTAVISAAVTGKIDVRSSSS